MYIVYIIRKEQIFGAVGWICSGPRRRVRRRKGKCAYRRDRAVACAYKILLCRLTVVGRELADCRVFIYIFYTYGRVAKSFTGFSPSLRFHLYPTRRK